MARTNMEMCLNLNGKHQVRVLNNSIYELTQSLLQRCMRTHDNDCYKKEQYERSVHKIFKEREI